MTDRESAVLILHRKTKDGKIIEERHEGLADVIYILYFARGLDDVVSYEFTHKRETE